MFASTNLSLILCHPFFSFQVLLSSQSPSHFCLRVHLSSDLRLVISSNCPWLDFVTLHFVFVPPELLILVPLPAQSQIPRTSFAIHICNNNKVFFQILNSFISSSKQSRTALILCENHKKVKILKQFHLKQWTRRTFLMIFISLLDGTFACWNRSKWKNPACLCQQKVALWKANANICGKRCRKYYHLGFLGPCCWWWKHSIKYMKYIQITAINWNAQ